MGVISFDRCVELYLILQVCGVDHDQAAGQLEQFPFLLNRFFFFFFLLFVSRGPGQKGTARASR